MQKEIKTGSYHIRDGVAASTKKTIRAFAVDYGITVGQALTAIVNLGIYSHRSDNKADEILEKTGVQKWKDPTLNQ